MRTVQFIQFREDSVFNSDYGYYPETLDLHVLIDENAEYEIESEDDDGNTTYEYPASILIEIEEFRLTGTRRRTRHVLKDNDMRYSKLIIELDDESQLFNRR